MTLRQSLFQAREMLLDYREHKLDRLRREMVEKVLASDVESERLLNQIIKGIEFSEQLSKVQINESFKLQLNQAESFSSLLVHYSQFKNWNQSLRTSTYAVMSCFFVVVIVMSLPRLS